MRKRVGILVFPDVEVLDFCGPFEVFSVTRLNEELRRQEPSPFEPLIVAESKAVVTATGGLKVVPDYSIDDCPPLAILVVPGGWGTRTEIKNARLLDWMRESFPAVTVEEKLHVVEDGNVLTSAGISAGIDMALRVVARYHGEAVARATARNMEYAYTESNARRI